MHFQRRVRVFSHSVINSKFTTWAAFGAVERIISEISSVHCEDFDIKIHHVGAVSWLHRFSNRSNCLKIYVLPFLPRLKLLVSKVKMQEFEQFAVKVHS